MKYVSTNSQLRFGKTIWYNVCILIKLFVNSDIYPRRLSYTYGGATHRLFHNAGVGTIQTPLFNVVMNLIESSR